MIQDKDIVLAVFSGSLSVAALLLVFLGFALSVYIPLQERDQPPKRILARLRGLVWAVVVIVIFAAVVNAISFVWLVNAAHPPLFCGLMFVLTASVVVIAVWAVGLLTR